MIVSLSNCVCGCHGNRVLLVGHCGGIAVPDRMLIGYRNAFTLLQHSFG